MARHGAVGAEERYYLASQRQLIWRSFVRHKLAFASGIVLILLYVMALLSEFFAPYDMFQRYPDYLYAPHRKGFVFSTTTAFTCVPTYTG